MRLRAAVSARVIFGLALMGFGCMALIGFLVKDQERHAPSVDGIIGMKQPIRPPSAFISPSAELSLLPSAPPLSPPPPAKTAEERALLAAEAARRALEMTRQSLSIASADTQIPDSKTQMRIIEKARKLYVEDQKEKIEQQLRTAPIAYKAPESIDYGETGQIGLAISLQSQEEAAKMLASIPGQENQASAPVSTVVRVKLTGPYGRVEIKLRGGDAAERQVVNAFSPVEWVWDVKGLEAGKADLSLQIFSEVNIDNEKEPVLIRSFDRSIVVNISFFGRIKQAVSEYGAVIGGFAAAVTAIAGFCTAIGWTPWNKNRLNIERTDASL